MKKTSGEKSRDTFPFTGRMGLAVKQPFVWNTSPFYGIFLNYRVIFPVYTIVSCRPYFTQPDGFFTVSFIPIPDCRCVQHSTVYPVFTTSYIHNPLQSNQSAGPVSFLIFCSISIFLLASLVAGTKPQRTTGADQQGTYSTIPIHWNIKSAPASPGRSHAGPALYVFSLLATLQVSILYVLQFTLYS